MPENKEFDNYIKSGSSRGVRNVIVNACQGKADSRDILNWLDQVESLFRNGKYTFKDDSNGLRNILSTIQDQRSYHQNWIRSTQAPLLGVNTYNGYTNDNADFRQDYNGRIDSYYWPVSDDYYNNYKKN